MRQSFQNNVTDHVREQFGIYLLVIFIFIMGITVGAFSVRTLGEGQVKELNEYFYGFLDSLTEQQTMNQGLVLQKSLIQNGKYILALWLCGVVFFGFLPALGFIFYRGFTIGFTVGFLAEQNAMRGILFAAGAVLPQNLLYVPVTMVAGTLAVSFSLMLLRQRLLKRSIPFGAYFFNYSLAMFVVGLVLATGSLIEAIITPVFMRAVVSLL